MTRISLEVWGGCVHTLLYLKWITNKDLLYGTDPIDCSMPGFPVLHLLLELAQTHVHWVGMLSNHLILCCPPSSPAFNLFQHQGLFQWVGPLNQAAEVWSFNLSISASNEYSGLISCRIDCFELLAVQETLKSLLQHHSLKDKRQYKIKRVLKKN